MPATVRGDGEGPAVVPAVPVVPVVPRDAPRVASPVFARPDATAWAVLPSPLTVALSESARPVTRVPDPIMRRSPVGDVKDVAVAG